MQRPGAVLLTTFALAIVLPARTALCVESEWRNASPSPSPRTGHALAYDSARGVTVLFGGFSYSDGGSDCSYGDTWEWDGDAWTLRATAGPSPRYYHALANDSARLVTVLFGGDNSFRRFEDTWDWDGATWALRATGGRSVRSNHALGYDSARGVTMLFGGWDSLGYDGETWVYGVVSCSGLERIQMAARYDRNGANQLKVILVGSDEGDTFTVTLTDGATQSGAVNSRGKGKAKFNNRPPGDAGIVTAEWGCGATDAMDYTCP